MITMTVNSLPTVTTTQVNVACFSGTTGTATALPSGGTGVYTYTWNTIPVQTSVTATGLATGTYIVTVADGNSCTATASAIITEPATALSGSIASQTNVSIPGGNDGNIIVAGAGGTSPYQYKIGSGVYQASGTFGTLAAGSYTVTVQDINLCTFDVTIIITEPAATLSGSISSQINVACFGTSTGSVIVTGSGGVPPYDYSLNAGTYQVSDTFGSLAAGTYTITVEDAVLSKFDVSVTITQPASSLGGSISSQTDVLCFGSNTGSVTVTGSGGVSPYQYKLGAGSYQASGSFGNLLAGSYTVTVQDANLCTSDVPVTISQPPTVLSGSITSQTNVSCFGSTNGSVTVAGSGGISPYMYSLNDGTFQVSGTFNNLAGTTYTITVQDANLCTANVPATIVEPAAILIAGAPVPASCPDVPDGSITLTITGGTQPYNMFWSDGVITPGRQNIAGGTYSVVVTDNNGCAASLDVVVGITASDKCIEIPTIITPNNDGVNDTWQIKNIDLFPNAEVFVFTRWGKLVFHSKNLAANPWNGTFEGTLLPTDSYHYVLHLNDGSKPRSGVISIIR
jgi:gliding motility-associated-like protein